MRVRSILAKRKLHKNYCYATNIPHFTASQYGETKSEYGETNRKGNLWLYSFAVRLARMNVTRFCGIFTKNIVPTVKKL
jgi:hypothetical protein